MAGNPTLQPVSPDMEIQDVRAIKFAGNFHQDSARFRAITVFVADPARPMAERVEALATMYKDGMGFDENVDASEVEAFVSEIPVTKGRRRRTYNPA